MSTPCENCGSHIRVCVDCDFYKGKYIEIPDNATNGDVIRALFPNEHDFETDFDEVWWNSPYQKGDKE